MKKLTEEQAAELFAAAQAWKAQGSRSKWNTRPSTKLWDVVDGIEKKNKKRRRWNGAGVPEVGEDIYVQSAYYLSRGRDDFLGGLCEVAEVRTRTSAGKEVPFVSVVERPGHGYNWEILKEAQEKLAKEYGEYRGRECPDNSKESNTW